MGSLDKKGDHNFFYRRLKVHPTDPIIGSLKRYKYGPAECSHFFLKFVN